MGMMTMRHCQYKIHACSLLRTGTSRRNLYVLGPYAERDAGLVARSSIWTHSMLKTSS